MNCPFCGCPDDKVIDSRSAREGVAIRRRRECVRCGKRFTTFEEIEQRTLVVVKKDGRREPFQISKVLESMKVACRKRPIPTSVLQSAAEDVEKRLLENYDVEVPSVAIGEAVLEKLAEIDSVAYVRFASVYQEFEEPEEFGEIVKALTRRAKRKQDASLLSFSQKTRDSQ